MKSIALVLLSLSAGYLARTVELAHRTPEQILATLNPQSVNSLVLARMDAEELIGAGVEQLYALPECDDSDVSDVIAEVLTSRRELVQR